MGDRSRVVKAGSRVRLGLASDEWLVACVRRGDIAAFEALYDRHARELLGFCMYMLGSRQDAEDAVQATLASAYRALRADSRPVALRPWLFTIARNDCLTILRKRRPLVELSGGEIASGSDSFDQLELREEVRRLFEGLRELPESQRAALVLAEVHGLSHAEVAEVLGARPDQVKAFIYQARSKLLSERAARDADCLEIREELQSARGAALLRGRLRRHVRSCAECRVYADGVARQRRQLGALLPVVPSIALRYRAIEEALGFGSADPVGLAGSATVGATAAEIAGGGVKALVCKVAAGMACLGASAGVGVSVLSAPEPSSGQGSSAATTAPARLLAASGQAGSTPWTARAPVATGTGGRTGAAGRRSTGAPLVAGGGHGGLPEVQNGIGGGGGGRATNGGAGDGSDLKAAPGSEGGGRNSAAGKEHSSGSSSEGERRASAEQRQTKQAGHRQLSEEHARAREERKASQPPPKSEEQIKREREEAARRHEEHKPEGHSRAPKTEEQLRVRHEQAERRRAERKRQAEEQKRAEKEAEEAAAGS